MIALAFALTGCVSLDVVGKDAVRAFGDALKAMPAQTDYEASWYIASPDGGAEFHWSGASAQMKAASKPFIDAGLDVSKLDSGDEEWLYYAANFATQPKQTASALAQFEYIASVGRKAIGYHTAMDHYNISLDGGGVFEWAKDLSANDKDIVFVLRAYPRISVRQIALDFSAHQGAWREA